MRIPCTLALLTCLTGPALADDFSRVEVETTDYDGNQPAGLPLWQTVSVTWDGEVDVRHFSPLHSDRFSGVATAAEMADLEAAVRNARLGDGIGATYSAAPFSEKFLVEGGPAELNGATRGEVDRAGPLAPRLAPLKAIALQIAERLVHPPALPDGQLEGRIEVSGLTTMLVVRGKDYEILPAALGDALAVLEGQPVRVEGVLTTNSGFFGARRAQVTALLEPTLADLRGVVAPGSDQLRIGDRDVQVLLPDRLESVFEHLDGDLTLRGYVRPGPRGPRSIVLDGVLATMTDDSFPLDTGDEVLVVAHRFSDRFTARRVSDDRETSVRLAEFAPSHVAPSATTGITGALGQP